MKRAFGLSSFLLKIIAAILMTLDHFAMFFIFPGYGSIHVTSYYILRAVGKMAFPLFAFCSVESIYNSSNKKNYLVRLFAFAYSLDLLGYLHGLIFNVKPRDNLILGNAFKDILFGTLMIYFLELKGKKKLLTLIPFVLGWLSIVDTGTSFGMLVKTDWSSYSIMLFLAMFLARLISRNTLIKKSHELDINEEDYLSLYLNKANKYSELIAIFVVGALYYLIFRLSGSAYLYPGKSSFIPEGTFNVLSIVFILFYNYTSGYKNKKLKWIFYFYYPIHLLIFYVVFLNVGFLF